MIINFRRKSTFISCNRKTSPIADKIPVTRYAKINDPTTPHIAAATFKFPAVISSVIVFSYISTSMKITEASPSRGNAPTPKYIVASFQGREPDHDKPLFQACPISNNYPDGSTTLESRARSYLLAQRPPGYNLVVRSNLVTIGCAHRLCRSRSAIRLGRHESTVFASTCRRAC